MTPDAFIARWAASGAAERANYQLFLSELCDLLGVARLQPATADKVAAAALLATLAALGQARPADDGRFISA